MVNLSRITSDPNAENGEAYIRDTGNSVSEIVSQMTGGKSGADVRKAHPELEADDIEQALVYAVKAFDESLLKWRHEALEGLGLVLSYCEPLLAGEFGPDNPVKEDDKPLFLEIIREGAWRSLDAWDDFLDWYHFTYEESGSDLQPIPFRQLIPITDNNRLGGRRPITLTNSAPDELPNVKCDQDLEHALRFLITSSFHHHLEAKATLEISINVPDRATIRISRELTSPSSSPIDPQRYWDWSNNPFTIAHKIIKKHGSEIQIHQSENAVTFEFSLPIWKDE